MKILQLTDLHFASYPFTESDSETAELIKQMVNEEKPDLIAITGDLISNYRLLEALPVFKGVIEFLDKLDTPIAITYGNHDSEGKYFKYLHDKFTAESANEEEFEALLTDIPDDTKEIFRNFDHFKTHSRHNIMEIVNEMTNHVEKQEVTIVDGREMYFMDIDEKTRLFFVDSGDYDYSGIGLYDAITFNQNEWLVKHSQDSEMTGHLFIHIPLPEYAEAVAQGVAVGHQEEKICSADFNTGTWSRIKLETNIQYIYCGHDHENDFIADYHGIKLIYGRSTGFNSYGKYPRGGRVIEISENLYDSFIIEGY
ncbi:metallophosphoesterase [Aerococcaceae bacterium 50-4]